MRTFACTDFSDVGEGKPKVDNGQCARLVQLKCHAPHTSQWRAGARVKFNVSLAKGIAIATFDADGHYPNRSTGNHAAIFDRLDDNNEGFWVWDQWKAAGTMKHRMVRYLDAECTFNEDSPCAPTKDGDTYYVIEAD